MSSPLPVALRAAIRDDARDPDTGLVRCAMCEREFPDESIQIDHITEEADGGSHDPVNLQPLCAPKAGAGCHRIKSRNSAKRRAAERKRAAEKAANGRPASFVAAGLTGAGALVAARCAWLSAVGQPVGTFLTDGHSWLGYGLAGAWGLGALAALGHAGSWTVPSFEDYAIDEDEPDEEPPVIPAEERLKTVLASVLGEDIRVRAADAAGFWVHYSDAVQDADDNSRYKIQERVNAKMPGRWKLTWITEKNRVLMAPRPDLPRMVRHPGLTDRPWNVIPIADNVSIDLTKTAHALIIGRTSSGKTALIRAVVLAVVASALRGEAEAVLLDPKRVELIGFRGWPGVREVVTREQEMWDLPLRLVAEMEERFRLYEEEGVRLNTHKRWIIVCDEYEDYVKSMQAMWTAIDPQTKKPRKQAGEKEAPPIAAMAKLLRKARKCGIHIIIGTQRPDASWFGGAARDNCECRIVVGSPSVGALRMVFERADVGRDIPAEFKGRFTIQNLDGEFDEGQGYWVPAVDDADGENTAEDWEHIERLRQQFEVLAG